MHIAPTDVTYYFAQSWYYLLICVTGASSLHIIYRRLESAVEEWSFWISKMYDNS